MTARICASAAFALTAATVVFALYWVWTSNRKRQLALMPLAILPALLVTGAALAGGGEHGTWWQQLAARTLSELRTHPDPLILVPLRDGIELCALFVGVLVLTRSHTSTAVSAVVGLALISRANVDIPLCALLLGCAALLCLTLTSRNEPSGDERAGPPKSAKKEQSLPAISAAESSQPTAEPAPTTKIATADYP
jgi:hypothetical protein